METPNDGEGKVAGHRSTGIDGGVFARFCRDIAAAQRAVGRGACASRRQKIGQNLKFFKYILLIPMKLQLLFDLGPASRLNVLPIPNSTPAVNDAHPTPVYKILRRSSSCPGLHGAGGQLPDFRGFVTARPFRGEWFRGRGGRRGRHAVVRARTAALAAAGRHLRPAAGCRPRFRVGRRGRDGIPRRGLGSSGSSRRAVEDVPRCRAVLRRGAERRGRKRPGRLRRRRLRARRRGGPRRSLADAPLEARARDAESGALQSRAGRPSPGFARDVHGFVQPREVVAHGPPRDRHRAGCRCAETRLQRGDGPRVVSRFRRRPQIQRVHGRGPGRHDHGCNFFRFDQSLRPRFAQARAGLRRAHGHGDHGRRPVGFQRLERSRRAGAGRQGRPDAEMASEQLRFHGHQVRPADRRSESRGQRAADEGTRLPGLRLPSGLLLFRPDGQLGRRWQRHLRQRNQRRGTRRRRGSRARSLRRSHSRLHVRPRMARHPAQHRPQDHPLRAGDRHQLAQGRPAASELQQSRHRRRLARVPRGKQRPRPAGLRRLHALRTGLRGHELQFRARLRRGTVGQRHRAALDDQRFRHGALVGARLVARRGGLHRRRRLQFLPVPVDRRLPSGRGLHVQLLLRRSSRQLQPQLCHAARRRHRLGRGGAGLVVLLLPVVAVRGQGHERLDGLRLQPQGDRRRHDLRPGAGRSEERDHRLVEQSLHVLPLRRSDPVHQRPRRRFRRGRPAGRMGNPARPGRRHRGRHRQSRRRCLRQSRGIQRRLRPAGGGHACVALFIGCRRRHLQRLESRRRKHVAGGRLRLAGHRRDDQRLRRRLQVHRERRLGHQLGRCRSAGDQRQHGRRRRVGRRQHPSRQRRGRSHPLHLPRTDRRLAHRARARA